MLVITIIVLLILAGVTVATLTGDNGLLQKAGEAKNISEDAEIVEQIKLAYTEWQVGKHTGDTKTIVEFMDDKLEEVFNISDEELDVSEDIPGTYIVKMNEKDYIFTVLDGKIEIETSVERIKKSTAKEDSYVGCFADIDVDGIVDRVIFADLLTGSIKETQTYGVYWNGTSGSYTLPSNVTLYNVNTYYVSQPSYTDTNFGTHPVISPKTNDKEQRFYIMQLENQNYSGHSSFYWYRNAGGKLVSTDTSSDFGTGITNTQTMINIWNANGGEGGYAGATQHDSDIWKYIQTEYSKGWFIPSKDEMGAFLNELSISADENSNIGFWSSSYSDSKENVRCLSFKIAKISAANCYASSGCRLAKTF